jgi:beta-lactam-binding protein with PASTA domain
MKQLLPLCLLLTAPTAAIAQRIPCSEVLETEREFVRRFGGCRDVAPIVDVRPNAAPTAPAAGTPVVALVPNVVGLSFDEARARLPGFNVQRSYVASAEPGGKILEQQPAPPARLAAGATIRVVVSDGTLRPIPRVAPTEVDAVRRAEVPAQPPVLAQPAPPSVSQPAPPSRSADSPVAQSSTEARRPATTPVPSAKAEARKPSPVASQRNTAPTKSSRAQVDSVPAASAAVAERTAPIETFELPNVVGRSSADATKALAEFKIERVEIVANAAPSGQVLAQDPKPGTAVAAGSAIGLQVSDGSLAASVAAPAAVSAAAPVAVPASTPASPPAPASKAAASKATPVRAPITVPSTAVLLLIAGVLAGLGLGALLMRRWLAKRHDTTDDFNLVLQSTRVDDASEVASAPAVDEAVGATSASAQSLGDDARAETVSTPARAIAVATAALAAPAAPVITFAARLEDGESKTTIEFAAPSDAEEMALEYSRGLDE